MLDELAPHIGMLQGVAAALAELDVLAALAEQAVRLDLAAPEFTDEAIIDIRGGRHLVVESQVEEFIANDVQL